MRGPGRVKAKQTVLKCFVPANAGNGISYANAVWKLWAVPCCFLVHLHDSAPRAHWNICHYAVRWRRVITRIQGSESVKHLYFILFPMLQCVGKIYNFSIVDVYAAQLQTRERMFCWILPVGSIVFGHLGPGFPSPRSSAPSRRCATQQLRELPFHRLIELRALLRGACQTTHYQQNVYIYIYIG